MKKALVVMAAGMGSRFGKGIKQLAPVGPSGETVMDYSIHDAISAGFDHVVFILRKDIFPIFQESVGSRLEKTAQRHGVKLDYVFQEVTDLPEGIAPVPDRAKPWGTCHAVLCCRPVLDSPFAVINADDFYGRDGFGMIGRELDLMDPKDPEKLCMVGYILKNTLSENGTVTRGICQAENGMLRSVRETFKIERQEDGLIHSDAGILTGEETVSMNLWGLTPAFLERMKDEFVRFLTDPDTNLQKDEFLLPFYIGEELEAGRSTVRVLRSHDTWFGMTYDKDLESTRQALAALTEKGVYARELYTDL